MFKINDCVSVCRDVKDENGFLIRKDMKGKIVRGFSGQHNIFAVNFGGQIGYCTKGILRKV